MTNAREKIKERQSQFVRSLFLPTEQLPEELDAKRLDVVRESLLHKRSATIARHWPHLHQALGEEWEKLFRSHFAESAHEFEDNAFVDGLRFARYAANQGHLGTNATEELVAAELRHDRIIVSRVTSEKAVVVGFRLLWWRPVAFVFR